MLAASSCRCQLAGNKAVRESFAAHVESLFVAECIFSMSSVKSVRPTLSLFLIADMANIAPSSATSSRLVCVVVPKVLRTTEVDQQVHGQFTLFTKELDERLVAASGHVPVDCAHIVANLIGTNLFELDAASLERRVPCAGQQSRRLCATCESEFVGSSEGLRVES